VADQARSKGRLADGFAARSNSAAPQEESCRGSPALCARLRLGSSREVRVTPRRCAQSSRYRTSWCARSRPSARGTQNAARPVAPNGLKAPETDGIATKPREERYATQAPGAANEETRHRVSKGAQSGNVDGGGIQPAYRGCAHRRACDPFRHNERSGRAQAACLAPAGNPFSPRLLSRKAEHGCRAAWRLGTAESALHSSNVQTAELGVSGLAVADPSARAGEPGA